jgi:hypothetical protein
MAIPAPRKREIRERQRERDDRADDRINALIGLEGADPTEVYDWSRQLVWSVYLNGRSFHPGCVFAGAGIRVQDAPEKPCAGCHRPLGDGTPQR